MNNVLIDLLYMPDILGFLYVGSTTYGFLPYRMIYVRIYRTVSGTVENIPIVSELNGSFYQRP